ncbi:MAG: type II toxin-antitoxin system VapC family toxin [Actinomycetia bacterium]|nr:type II toxin-antitoxin system VapC family toxin [Actinomycetes bacterium]
MSQTVYVDASALAALLLHQPHSEALAAWLDTTASALVSCDLLETELRRVAVREECAQSDVSALLDGVAVASLDRAAFRSAGLIPLPHLRTLDALHLEAALRLGADAVLTYDQRLAEAAAAVGLQVLSPGLDQD